MLLVAHGAMRYIASFSGGKDSTAMVVRLLEEGMPLDEVVFYDTGMEFKATYGVVGRVADLVRDSGKAFTVLHPQRPFLLDMLAKPVNAGKDGGHYGYEWCGGCARWGTAAKTAAIEAHIGRIGGEALQYIGIAADEGTRAKPGSGRAYPLIGWGMSEADCLAFCRERGFSWMEDGIDLYGILDRVSCWCCANKNLRELRNMRTYLPAYWGMLLGLQSRIGRPFRKDATVFDLDERFAAEDRQMRLFDLP